MCRPEDDPLLKTEWQRTRAPFHVDPRIDPHIFADKERLESVNYLGDQWENEQVCDPSCRGGEALTCPGRRNGDWRKRKISKHGS